ncbi:YidH family protein [Actinomadura harenae]|uniref:DUF202 domain-containing protein n=1 Tax=Actinomadura harenae TaxID=2483351 RepID=A0A3M2LP25_9ACTN|nr:DUF202 domain-containing protein [Actinomadura harenae]RMI36578.1 DUF202 domain-containing protein [Actinomadura harenae]
MEEKPDARYLLANERTYLAWMRTCLAFIVGGAALSQLGVEHRYAWLRALTVGLAVLGGIVMTPLVYRHWRVNERALRSDAPLPGHHLPSVFLALTLVIGAGLVALLALAR